MLGICDLDVDEWDDNSLLPGPKSEPPHNVAGLVLAIPAARKCPTVAVRQSRSTLSLPAPCNWSSESDGALAAARMRDGKRRKHTAVKATEHTEVFNTALDQLRAKGVLRGSTA